MKVPLQIFVCYFCLTKLAFGGHLVPQGRVSGGEEATYGSVPYIVSIETVYGDGICAGVIIASQWILTAAHCFSYANSYMRIATGSVNLEEPDELYLVNKTVHHCFYDQPPAANDIGLIKTDRPIVFDNNTQPIKMAKVDDLREGYKLQIAGWGAKETDGTFVNILRTAEVEYFNWCNCKDMVNFQIELGEGNICTGTSYGAGTCLGDSGGPLTYENKLLFGIINWGTPCALGYPDVYASVPYYYDWIHGVMNGEMGCQKN